MQQQSFYFPLYSSSTSDFLFEKPLCLIPCAGFGTRVGTPEAKELLSHPLFPEHSFLEVAIDLALKNNCIPLVITRNTKKVLLEFIFTKKILTDLLVIPETKEWPETIWHSRFYWKKKNILLLPDTSFFPKEALNKLSEFLEEESEECIGKGKLGLGIFKVEDSSLWSVLEHDERVGEWFLKEKPVKSEISRKKSHFAWGLMAFSLEVGVSLWSNYCKLYGEKRPIPLPTDGLFLYYLKDFVDWQRS